MMRLLRRGLAATALATAAVAPNLACIPYVTKTHIYGNDGNSATADFGDANIGLREGDNGTSQVLFQVLCYANQGAGAGTWRSTGWRQIIGTPDDNVGPNADEWYMIMHCAWNELIAATNVKFR